MFLTTLPPEFFAILLGPHQIHCPLMDLIVNRPFFSIESEQMTVDNIDRYKNHAVLL